MGVIVSFFAGLLVMALLVSLPGWLLWQEIWNWRRRAKAAEAENTRRFQAISRTKTQPPVARQVTADETVPSAVRRRATPLEPWTPPDREDDDG